MLLREMRATTMQPASDGDVPYGALKKVAPRMTWPLNGPCLVSLYYCGFLCRFSKCGIFPWLWPGSRDSCYLLAISIQINVRLVNTSITLPCWTSNSCPACPLCPPLCVAPGFLHAKRPASHSEWLMWAAQVFQAASSGR